MKKLKELAINNKTLKNDELVSLKGGDGPCPECQLWYGPGPDDVHIDMFHLTTFVACGHAKVQFNADYYTCAGWIG